MKKASDFHILIVTFSKCKIITRIDTNILRPDSESLDHVLFEKFNYLRDDSRENQKKTRNHCGVPRGPFEGRFQILRYSVQGSTLMCSFT